MEKKDSMIKLSEVAKMDYEVAFCELEKITDELSNDNIKLKQSIDYFELGEALHKRCEKLLDDAQLRIDKLKHTKDKKRGLGEVELETMADPTVGSAEDKEGF